MITERLEKHQGQVGSGVRIGVIVVLLLLGMVGSARAQGGILSELEGQEIAGVPVMRYARPGEVTVKVLVMGAVGRTGIYFVGESTAMDELLALSGGLSTPPETNRQTRDATVRLYRQQGGVRTLIYEAPLDEMLQQPQAYPNLQDEDVFVLDVMIEQHWDWRDYLRVITGISSIISIGLRLERLFR